jgi:small conductance mechanosensitive channel
MLILPAVLPVSQSTIQYSFIIRGKDNSMDFSKAYNLVIDKISQWLTTLIYMLPNIAVAVIIVVLFYLAAKFFRKLTLKILNRFSHHLSVNNLMAQVIFLIVFMVGFFIALGILELDTAVTSLLAGVGLVGLILGFAFQDIAANFIAGIIISFEQPYKINDLIETNDHFGTVKIIRIRTTEIITPRGEYVIIPNKEVYTNPLINYSVSGQRRIDLDVGISYGENLEQVQSITAAAVKGIDYQDDSKEVEVFFNEYGDSSINFTVRFWIKTSTEKEYKKATSEAIILIKKAYDENNILIPFPIRTMDFGIKGGVTLSEALPKKDDGQ